MLPMLPTDSTPDSLGKEMYSESPARDSEPGAPSAPFSLQASRATESLDTVMDTVSSPKEGEANESNLAYGIRMSTFVPFLAHFIFTLGISAFALTYIDSRNFYITSRSPTAIEPDGSISNPADFAPLQSDITTALSFGATLTRVMGTWWSASIVWRCLFNLMERGGLTLEAATKLLESWLPLPWPSNVGRRRSLIVVYVVILATFVLGFSSPLIAGSITWNQSSLWVRGSKPIKYTSQYSSLLFDIFDNLFDRASTVTLIEPAAKDAQLAWGDNRRNSTVMTRVLRDSSQFPLSHYPLNSTLQSVRLPYMAIDAFEVIKDPNSTLTPKQKALLKVNHTGNPFSFGVEGSLNDYPIPGTVALIPDDQWGDWRVGKPPSPTIARAETRVLGVLTDFGLVNCSHSSRAFGKIPQEAGLYFQSGFIGLCFVFARVTYRAGAADCERCPITLPNVVQNDTVLHLQQDRMTFFALPLAPMLGSRLVRDNYSIPYSFDNFQDYTTEVLSRSYQIAWSTLANTFGGEVETDINIPVLALRASIQQWRVYTWLGLNMIALLSGLFFVFMHRYHYKRPWLEHPQMAGFLLDTRDVLLDDGWDGDPWDRQTGYPPGLLVLQRGGTRQRSVTLTW